MYATPGGDATRCAGAGGGAGGVTLTMIGPWTLTV